MEDVVGDHLARIRTAVLQKYTSAQIAEYITKHTKYAGQPYSYKDHEFQQKILSDTSQDVVVRKCSQIGLSEASARMGLALVNVLRPYTVIYTLPTATFAGTFAKTRMDPVIEGSKEMRGSVHKTNNNNEVKQFGDSFIYIRGAASTNAPISIPADHLIHDEFDFSDQEVLGQYVSRLTHSKWKRTHKFSTPTLPGFGISKAFDETRRHFNFVKCNHCNHQFIPSFYDHTVIPGYTRDLREINKQTLTYINWKDAFLACPKCGKEPSLQVEHREWVCENASEPYVAAGYQVSPFDAPNIISVPSLIQASTKYDRRQDFDNFNLGLPAEDSEATLTRADLEHLFVHAEAGESTVHVMGVDTGNVYHFKVGAVDPFGGVFIVHREVVPMGRAKERYEELRLQYRVVCTVMDSAPHAETVMSLQQSDVNLFASVYTKSKSLLTHVVVDKEEDAHEGKDFVRQVNINRSRALDGYMAAIRENKIAFKAGEDQEVVIAHHMSMKRVKVFENESGEMQYSWQKTDGVDHFHHTGLYCWIASKIKGVGRSIIALPTSSMFSFRLTHELPKK